jgi:hypothetical protein
MFLISRVVFLLVPQTGYLSEIYGILGPRSGPVNEKLGAAFEAARSRSHEVSRDGFGEAPVENALAVLMRLDPASKLE